MFDNESALTFIPESKVCKENPRFQHLLSEINKKVFLKRKSLNMKEEMGGRGGGGNRRKVRKLFNQTAGENSQYNNLLGGRRLNKTRLSKSYHIRKD